MLEDRDSGAPPAANFSERDDRQQLASRHA
jgi:hypothetical protein